MTRTAVVVERGASPKSHAAVQEAVLYLRLLGYETTELESVRPGDRTGTPQVDLVVLSAGPGAGKTEKLVAEVKHFHETFPRAFVLVTIDSINTTTASVIYRAGAAVVAPPDAFAEAVRNATARDAVNVSDAVRVRVIRGTSRHPIEEEIVEEFHDSETGLLDAARVAAAYGVSLSALAPTLNVTQSALSKRTTAPAAQPGLRELEFGWAALLDAVKTPERARAWLRAQRRDLDGRPPITLLLDGSAEAFANYIRSVIAGEPG